MTSLFPPTEGTHWFTPAWGVLDSLNYYRFDAGVTCIQSHPHDPNQIAVGRSVVLACKPRTTRATHTVRTLKAMMPTSEYSIPATSRAPFQIWPLEGVSGELNGTLASNGNPICWSPACTTGSKSPDYHQMRVPAYSESSGSMYHLPMVPIGPTPHPETTRGPSWGHAPSMITNYMYGQRRVARGYTGAGTWYIRSHRIMLLG